MRKDIFSDKPPELEHSKLRQEVQNQIAEFLNQGGRIDQVPIGATAYNKDGSNPLKKKYGVTDGKNTVQHNNN